MEFSRHIPLPGSFNIRDLGGYATPAGQTARRRFLRADSLHRLSAGSLSKLTGMGCGTVIDLRHDHELEAHPNPFANGTLPGTYHHVSLFEALDPEHAGVREAPDLLLALYKLALAERGDSFARVFAIIAGAPGGVLFHCTAGKDRTGMIAALLLSLAGVAKEDIVADYALTTRYMPGLVAALQVEARHHGVEIDPASPVLLSEAATMRGFLAHLDQRFGGAETYLTGHGLAPRTLDRLRARLTDAPTSEGEA